MGQPKALLKIDGETFAARLTRILRSVADPVILVTGASTNVEAPGATIVHNPDWESGQLTSLQTGFRAISPDAPAAFFVPVDCPMFTVETVTQLWNAYASQPHAFVIPRLDGRRGHPVLASREMIDAILALPPSGQARDVVHAHRDRTLYVDVTDTGIFTDIDTPSDYAALERGL